MNELNALATQINQTNINSCEVAATMLGGMWPKTDQSSKHLCQAMGSNLGSFSDWASARQGCGAKGQRENVFKGKGSDPRYQDMLMGEFNLAWKALQMHSFLRADKELAQLFLTLVGSILVKQKGDSLEARVLPSYADRDEVMQALLYGGQTSLYQCDADKEDKCLNPPLQHSQIPIDSALLNRVQIVLQNLVDKIYNDEAATKEEQDFLNATHLPVYKMLNVITAYRKGHAPLDITHYSELIALGIVCKYILEVIDLVHESVHQLRSIQVDDTHIERFLKQLSTARSRVLQRRQSAYQQMDSMLSFIQATRLIEKQLHVMMGSLSEER